MQINRLFEIVTLLLKNGTMTSAALAEHFGVSVRTVLRDVTVLSTAGVPIVTTQGRGGGISILEGYVVSKAVFSEEEQNEILAALQSTATAGRQQANNALTKLSAIFQKNATDWIEIDLTRWGQGEQDNLRFALLKQAVLEKLAVKFNYVASTGETQPRTVVPLKLVFKAHTWYLQSYCLTRQDYRTFKLNRMLALQTTNLSFAGRKFSPPPIEGPSISSFVLVPLLLTFPPQTAPRLYDFEEFSIPLMLLVYLTPARTVKLN